MIDEKRNLLKNITETFFNKGFYKTTMDDIAAELRISKKTIYRYFPSKEFLMNLIVHAIVFTVRKEFKSVIAEKKTSVEKLFAITDTLFSLASRVNVNAILDIKRLGPQFWNTIEILRTKQINANIGKLIVQGQQEGYIVPIPSEIILAIYIASIQAVINPDFILKNEFSIKQAGVMTFEILINGILTEEGKKLYSKLKTERA